MDDILGQLEKEVEEEKKKQYLAKWGLLRKEKKLNDFQDKKEEKASSDNKI